MKTRKEKLLDEIDANNIKKPSAIIDLVLEDVWRLVNKIQQGNHGEKLRYIDGEELKARIGV